MKITLKVTNLDGEVTSATAIPVDFMAWERHTKGKVSQLANGAGMEDLLFLAWSVLSRNGSVDKFDDWAANVSEIEAEDDDPKATAKGR